MRIYLVRHSRPLSEKGICYGRSDVALSEPEYLLTLKTLTEVLPKHIPLFSSPLQRCAMLASDLANILGSAVPLLDPRLREMDFGKWELQPWEGIPRSEVDAWANDLPHYRPGDGEQLIEMARRVSAFYEDLIQMHSEDCAVICHAGTIRLLMARRQGLSPLKMVMQAAAVEHKIAYGEVVEIEL